MKLLISGQEVLIDDEDYPIVSRYNWYLKKGYKPTDINYICCEVTHNRKKMKISLHRLLMGMGQLELDHVNGNPLDNRKNNLRYCTPAQQQYNRRRANKTGYKGVRQYGKNSFHAIVTKNKVSNICGPFKTAIEAARAYDKLALKLFGEFAALNFTRSES